MKKVVHVGVALALLAGAPLAFGQKMHKCPDGKGGVVFQQGACPETDEQAEARKKERERIQAEQAKKKEEEERKKAETIQKAKERDKAYLEQQEERRKIEEAEKKAQGTLPQPVASARDDGALPDNVAETYPGPWKDGMNPVVTGAFTKKGIQGCDSYRVRQRAGGGDFLVQCKSTGVKQNHYFVWPQSEAVYGPVRY